MRWVSAWAKVVFISGNDGSGKSTFQRRLARRLEGRGKRVKAYHYYDSLVRRLLRGMVEQVVGVSRRKRELEPGGEVTKEAGIEVKGGGSSQGRRVRRWILGIFLWGYQSAMLVETWCRNLLSGADVVLVNRSFVDDLISTSLTLRCDLPVRLLRFSGRAFPIRKLFYLSAGHAIEYARIVDVDLSPQFHRLKGERYEQAVRELEGVGLAVRRVNTGRGRRAGGGVAGQESG